jgi:rod shape-determining protein MreD
MTPYLMMSAFAFLLVIVQNCLLEPFLFHKVSAEISLLVVLYAAWSWKNVRGVFITLLLGLLMDWSCAPFYGLYSFSYMLVFLVARSLDTVLRDRAHGEILIVALAVFIEFLVFLIFYGKTWMVDILGVLLRDYLPQAIFLCLVSPLLFRLMASLETRFSDE